MSFATESYKQKQKSWESSEIIVEFQIGETTPFSKSKGRREMTGMRSGL